MMREMYITSNARILNKKNVNIRTNNAAYFHTKTFKTFFLLVFSDETISSFMKLFHHFVYQ